MSFPRSWRIPATKNRSTLLSRLKPAKTRAPTPQARLCCQNPSMSTRSAGTSLKRATTEVARARSRIWEVPTTVTAWETVSTGRGKEKKALFTTFREASRKTGVVQDHLGHIRCPTPGVIDDLHKSIIDAGRRGELNRALNQFGRPQHSGRSHDWPSFWISSGFPLDAEVGQLLHDRMGSVGQA